MGNAGSISKQWYQWEDIEGGITSQRTSFISHIMLTHVIEGSDTLKGKCSLFENVAPTADLGIAFHLGDIDRCLPYTSKVGGHYSLAG